MGSRGGQWGCWCGARPAAARPGGSPAAPSALEKRRKGFTVLYLRGGRAREGPSSPVTDLGSSGSEGAEVRISSCGKGVYLPLVFPSFLKTFSHCSRSASIVASLNVSSDGGGPAYGPHAHTQGARHRAHTLERSSRGLLCSHTLTVHYYQYAFQRHQEGHKEVVRDASDDVSVTVLLRFYPNRAAVSARVTYRCPRRARGPGWRRGWAGSVAAAAPQAPGPCSSRSGRRTLVTATRESDMWVRVKRSPPCNWFWFKGYGLEAVLQQLDRHQVRVRRHDQERIVTAETAGQRSSQSLVG
jgi:hypothetical protein